MGQALAGVGKDFNQKLVVGCQAVKKEAVLAVMRKYILPLFTASSSVAIAVSPSGKATATAETLAQLGFDVEVLEDGELPEGSKRRWVPENQNTQTGSSFHSPVLDLESWTELAREKVRAAKARAMVGFRAMSPSRSTLNRT